MTSSAITSKNKHVATNDEVETRAQRLGEGSDGQSVENDLEVEVGEEGRVGEQPPSPFDKLPDEILQHILSFVFKLPSVNAKELVQYSVSKRVARLAWPIWASSRAYGFEELDNRRWPRDLHLSSHLRFVSDNSDAPEPYHNFSFLGTLSRLDHLDVYYVDGDEPLLLPLSFSDSLRRLPRLCHLVLDIDQPFSFADSTFSVWKLFVDNGVRKAESSIVPSVVQIRLSGSKGVLAVDNRLPGSCLTLRPSMDKFQGFPDVDSAGNPIYTLNIADVFTRPSSLKLNELTGQRLPWSFLRVLEVYLESKQGSFCPLTALVNSLRAALASSKSTYPPLPLRRFMLVDSISPLPAHLSGSGMYTFETFEELFQLLSSTGVEQMKLNVHDALPTTGRMPKLPHVLQLKLVSSKTEFSTSVSEGLISFLSLFPNLQQLDLSIAFPSSDNDDLDPDIHSVWAAHNEALISFVAALRQTSILVLNWRTNGVSRWWRSDASDDFRDDHFVWPQFEEDIYRGDWARQ